MDYFLLNKNATDLVKKVGIGKVCTLSDHRPIFLHFSLNKVQKGGGFWRFNNDLLNDPEFIFGCNYEIKKTIISYSELKHCRVADYPPDQEFPLISPVISSALLHDVILMNCRTYTMNYQAKKKREMLKKEERLTTK